MKRILYIFLLCNLYNVLLLGQQTVEGIVLDQHKEPLAGVSILVKDGTRGTVTDVSGRFEITLQESYNKLEFIYLGFKTKIITVESNTINIEVILEESSVKLDKIVVRGFPTVAGRARKRRENIQNISETVTAISAKELQNQGVNNIEGVLSKIPNISYNNYQDAGNFAINIRGITSIRNGEAPVSIVVDDIQLPNTEQLITDFYDIEQIEVLKGPQGTLYGKNAIAGAINYTTKQPTNTLRGKIKTSFATGIDYKLVAALSGGLIADKLYGSFATSYRSFRGYENQKNVFLDEFTNNSNEISFKGQLIAKIFSNLRLTLKGRHSNLEGGAMQYIQTPENENGANFFKGRPRANLLGESELKTTDLNLKAELRTNAGRLLSILSYGDGKYSVRGDLDHTSEELLYQLASRDFNAINQEIRWVSKEYKNFNFVSGLFYQNKQTKPLFQAGIDGRQGFNGMAFPASISENTNNTFALFGQANLNLSKSIELTTGLRYDNDKRIQNDLTNDVKRQKIFTQIQPKIGISFKLSKSTLLYSNYAVGYRSGGFNAPRSTDVTVANPDQFLEDYEKETTNNIEVGIKNTFIDNRFMVNVAYFRTYFDNEQVYVVDLTTVTPGIFNIEKVLNQGVEIEAKFRATNSFDVGASYGFIDSEIKKASIAKFFIQPSGVKGGNWEGNAAPFVSKNTFTFFGDYHRDNLNFYFDVNLLGKFFWHPDNFDVQNSYSKVNTKLSYSIGKFDLAIFGNNIFNTNYNSEYFSKEFSTAPQDLRFPAAPAIFGTELSYKF
ncbi:MAG: TonB-dependent receptor [Tenacibaculum sp.]